MSDSRIPVVCYGLGPIGRAAARLALSRSRLRVVGAVDRAPDLVGRDLALVAGLQTPCGVTISEDADHLFSTKRADVVIHATGSRFADVYDQISAAAGCGVHVVSSCEELLFPWYSHPELADELAALARSSGATVLGTGVNPGFVLDTLPLCLSGVCREIRRIEATRVVDAGTRREPLVRKVGAGLDVAEFRRLQHEGRIGHVGLVESLALIAEATGLGKESGALEIQESLDPVLAEKRIQAAGVTIEPGRVAGIHHVAVGSGGGQERIRLDLSMYVGAPNVNDKIRIEGDPSLELVVTGGTPGDVATAGILVNMVPVVAAAPAGLLTMIDIPIPRYTG